MSYRAMWLHALCHMTSMRRRYGNNKAIRFKWWSPKKLMLGAQLEYFKLMWQGLMAVCWVILRGQYIYTVIQAVLSLLYIEAKCRFFSVVTWKDIIKYLQNCEGCTRFCEILCIYIYIYRYMHKVCIRGTFMSMPDISAWMKEHHLQLNLVKTELLVFPTTPTLQHDFTIQIDWAKITPSSSVRNLGVIFDDQLTFKNHIAKTARSCRFALHNIRKIRPFLTQHAAQLLVQALVIFRLDYCNAILAGLPSCTIKPLQMIQYAAARLVFSKPKRAHVTPLSPCTGSRLQLASSSRHWCLHIEQPQAQHPPTSTHWWQSTFLPEAWDLRVSDASWCHHREAQNHFPEHFIHRSWLVEWTSHPIRNVESLTIFKRHLKTHLFRLHMTSASSS